MQNNNIHTQISQSDFMMLLTGERPSIPLNNEFKPFDYHYVDEYGQDQTVKIKSVHIEWNDVYYDLPEDAVTIEQLDTNEQTIGKDAAGRIILCFNSELHYNNILPFTGRTYDGQSADISLPDNQLTVTAYESIIVPEADNDLQYGIENKLCDQDYDNSDGNASIQFPLDLKSYDFYDNDMNYFDVNGDDLDEKLSDAQLDVLTSYLFRRGIPKIKEPNHTVFSNPLYHREKNTRKGCHLIIHLA